MKNNQNLGIYIHIPFCKRKCYYCDFCSYLSNDKIKADYVKALIEQISCKRTVDYFGDRTIDTIYFGGGTPTCLPAETLAQILNAVFLQYNVSKDTEITVECNPGTISRDDLMILRQNGFNRLSIGMQSAHNDELQQLGRTHSINDFETIFNSARSVGFDNISIDLMYGIPRQTLLSFSETLRAAIEYSPEHISAYALKIEPGTVFYKNKGSLLLPDEDCEYNMYDMTVKELSKAGYEHYEISNYAKHGLRSRHNKKYWNCDDFIGFGVAAHSCVGKERYSVTTSIQKYIKHTDDSIITIEESLTDEEFSEEYIMMRMRLSDGLSIRSYTERFGQNFEKKYLPRMMPYIKSGHIIYNDSSDRICFSAEGMYVSNYILSSVLDLGQ